MSQTSACSLKASAPCGRSAILLALAALAAPALAQFGPERIVVSGGGAIQDVQAADVDGDGDEDVVVCRDAGSLPTFAWHANLGGGTFGNAQPILAQPGYANRVRAFDDGHDGDVDLVASVDLPNRQLVLYQNQGGGVFQSFPLDVVDNVRPVIAFGDIDGDGNLDLFYSRSYETDVYWRRGLAQGGFGPREIASTQVFRPVNVVLADLDGDGDPDLAATDMSLFPPEVSWFENTGGSPPFGPEQVLDTFATSSSGLDAVDLDGDADLDLLYLVEPPALRWVENLGQGVFGNIRTLTTFGDLGTVVLGIDLDGDSDLDVLATGTGVGAAWYPNDGAGNFAARQMIAWGMLLTRTMDVADFSGDGIPDVVLASNDFGSTRVAWFENRVIGPIGSNFCEPAIPNSTGLPGVMTAVGSPSIAVGHVTLRATQVPADKPSLFIASLTTGYVPNFGGGVGLLCIGPPIRRFGGVASTSQAGDRPHVLDFATSFGATIQPGQSWHFQLWHRDAGGPNLTDGLQIVFTP